MKRMQNGFTLIELCAVLLIMGLVTAALADNYHVYSQNQRLLKTYSTFNNTLSASLNTFYGVAHRLPCPADPSLPLTDPMSGHEQINFTTQQCLVTGGIVRTNTGTRTLQGAAAPSFIAIGAFPYWTIRDAVKQSSSWHGSATALASQNDTVDSWGNQITYAVTESMAAQTYTSPSNGAIYVETENFQGSCTPGSIPPTCQELTNPAGSAQYILVSHGDDGVGAYPTQGTAPLTPFNPCPAVGTTADAQNCSGTGLFIQGLRSMGTSTPGTYFDDVVFFNAAPITALWAPVLGTPSDIYNLNEGNVGVGTGTLATPTARLQVVGNCMRAAAATPPLFVTVRVVTVLIRHLSAVRTILWWMQQQAFTTTTYVLPAPT